MHVSRMKPILLVFLLFMLVSIACGGASASIGFDVTAQAENVVIEGLPQYICPTSTPIPTNTPIPTSVQPTVYVAPSNYVTYTPVAGCVWNGFTCATHTPFPGGFYLNPAYTLPGLTSTPPATYTPYPSPTAFTSSYFYFFDDDVFTRYASSSLDLRLRIGNIRTISAAQVGVQISIWEVQIENRGSTFYVVMAPVQIYVSQIAGASGAWASSQTAANEAGISLDTAAIDGVEIQTGETLIFDMAAYTAIGTVESIAYILNPYGNGYDGQIAGGNLAYWIEGSHADCLGNVDGGFVPTPSTPHPTATATLTIESCAVVDCATQIP